MIEKVSMLNYSHTQYLKGIAILFVIISHIGNYSGKTWFTPLGGIGVSLFLFCSGFGLMSSFKKNGLYGFWRRKLISIYVPFVFVEIVASLVIKSTFTELLLDLLFIRWLSPIGWYMQYLFISYLIFYLGVRFIPNIIVRRIIWVGIAVCSFFFCGNLRAEQCVSFLLGVYMAEHYTDIKNFSFTKRARNGVVFIFVATILLAVKQLPQVREQSHYVITLFNLLLKSGFMLGIILITSSVLLLPSLFKYFGKMSYELYLTHGYFLWIISENIFGKYLLNSLVMSAIGICSALVLNYLITKYKKVMVRYATQGVSNKQ